MEQREAGEEAFRRVFDKGPVEQEQASELFWRNYAVVGHSSHSRWRALVDSRAEVTLMVRLTAVETGSSHDRWCEPSLHDLLVDKGKQNFMVFCSSHSNLTRYLEFL
jgi:hypothetical protein